MEREFCFSVSGPLTRTGQVLLLTLEHPSYFFLCKEAEEPLGNPAWVGSEGSSRQPALPVHSGLKNQRGNRAEGGLVA